MTKAQRAAAIKVLKDAHDFLSGPRRWMKHSMFRGDPKAPDACCLDGALIFAATGDASGATRRGLGVYNKARSFVARCTPRGSIRNLNDAVTTRKANVLETLQCAIKDVEQA